MDSQPQNFREPYVRLTQMISMLYREASKSRTSLQRQLHNAETSRSDTAQDMVPQLQTTLAIHESIVMLLGLLVDKAVKEERLAHLDESLRDYFERVAETPEAQDYGRDS
jgi:hypothetical protein